MSRKIIEPRLWGKDHWTTLMYMETCVVDRKGRIVRQQMRVDRDRHPELAHVPPGLDGGYPTRLRDGVLEKYHDDYDCLRDMEAAGLLDASDNRNVKLTPRGWRWAWYVRRWVGEGHNVVDLTAEHVVGADKESVNAMARSLRGGDTPLGAALYQAGITDVTEDEYRALLMIAQPPIHACVECGDWIHLKESRDDLCLSCYDILSELDRDEDEILDDLELSLEWPPVTY